MQAVERRNHITVLRLAILIRQLIESIARNSHNVRRVVNIHLLFRTEAVDKEDMYSFIISIIIFLAAFIGTRKYKVNPILMIIVCGIAGLILY